MEPDSSKSTYIITLSFKLCNLSSCKRTLPLTTNSYTSPKTLLCLLEASSSDHHHPPPTPLNYSKEFPPKQIKFICQKKNSTSITHPQIPHLRFLLNQHRSFHIVIHLNLLVQRFKGRKMRFNFRNMLCKTQKHYVP